MEKNAKQVLVWSIVAIILIAAITFFLTTKKNQKSAGNVAAFAQCLKDKGAVFYGAYWCPHCQAQKAAFGDAQKLLPYVECSTPDGSGQLQICTDKNIDGYPTWIFADGSRESGELSFATLSQKTGCQAP